MGGDHTGTPPSDEKTDTAENITSQQFRWKLQVVWLVEPVLYSLPNLTN